MKLGQSPWEKLTVEQQRRYLHDVAFHVRVDIAARALWWVASTVSLPYNNLIEATKQDLTAYALVVVEALEEFDE